MLNKEVVNDIAILRITHGGQQGLHLLGVNQRVGPLQPQGEQQGQQSGYKRVNKNNHFTYLRIGHI